MSDELWIFELSRDHIPQGNAFRSLALTIWPETGFLLLVCLQKTGLVPEVETISSVLLPWSSSPVFFRFNLRAQRFFWEAELVTDCHPDGEIEWLQQLLYMPGEDVIRPFLQHSFKETRVCVFGGETLLCLVLPPLLHVREPLGSFRKRVGKGKPTWEVSTTVGQWEHPLQI